MAKSILIVTYSYSSLDGVSSRRWIKYSHSLADSNHDVFVLCSHSKLRNEERHPKIKYFTFRSRYPIILESTPKSYLEKFEYRIQLFKQKLTVKGSPYDKACLDQKEVCLNAGRIISEENIKNVVVSGAPFSLLYYGTLLKQLHNQINLISDLRDPWTAGHIYGMLTLDGSRKEEELQREERVLRLSDTIFVASNDIKSRLIKQYGTLGRKTKLLLNGIEKSKAPISYNPSTRNFILTHIGTINSGTSKYWRPLLDWIANTEMPIKLRFIGLRNPKVLEAIYTYNSTKIEVIDRMPESKIAPFLEESSAFLMFKKDGLENSYPSKFFDYIKYRRPIIAFSRTGIVAEEIIANRLGIVLDENFDSANLDWIFIKLIQNDLEFNAEYEWEKFSIEHLTLEIENVLE